jgi:hypothetical protein
MDHSAINRVSTLFSREKDGSVRGWDIERVTGRTTGLVQGQSEYVRRIYPCKQARKNLLL